VFKRKKPDPESASDNPLARRVVRGDDSPTQPPKTEQKATGDPAEEPATRVQPSRSEATTRLLRAGPQPDTADAGSIGDDAPVAVLLVISGPGTGRLLAVGHGINRLGRQAEERVSLPFGDERISRRDHARIVFDEIGQRFFLQQGEGSALTWLDGEPVLEPQPLSDGARIRLGDSELLFRPLIGADFQWHMP